MKQGDIIGGYVIERPISLGKTGQADVFCARHVEGKKSLVAIKFLADHLKTDKKSIRNFEEEAELLSKLNHNNIVRIEAFDTSQPHPYIAQEYIDGVSVAEYLNTQDKSLSFKQILNIAVQVAEALSYAHSLEYFKISKASGGGKSSKKYKGIVHRDLSTDNILITKSGDVKLIDFGIARAAGLATVTTTTGVGKQFYIAPEVEIQSPKVFSPTVDIYSFGVCLYEMVMTGRPEKQRIRVLKQFQTNINRLQAAFPDEVPIDLNKIISRCVQREPKDRPQDIDEVKNVLISLQKIFETKEAAVSGTPQGIVIGSELLSFDKILNLGHENAGDPSMGFTINEDETRIFILCLDRSKVLSLNLSGGEKQVYHVPQGKKLAALAGAKGEKVLGVLEDRSGFLMLDETGEWNIIKGNIELAKPKTVLDNIILLGKSIYIGDYSVNTICRVLCDDGSIISNISHGVISNLGPFALSGDSIYCLDMLSKSILRSDLELKSVSRICTLSNIGWPVSMAAGKRLIYIIDSQNRSISIITATGEYLADNAVSWQSNYSISQIAFSHKHSKLIALDTSNPALLFFNVQPVDYELLDLRNVARDMGICPSELSYPAIESAVISSINKQLDKRCYIIKLATKIHDSKGSGSKGKMLQISLYSLVPTVVASQHRKSSLREISIIIDDLGAHDKAKDLYLQYLNEVNGFDPEIRDRYGRLLELNMLWDQIKEFEGIFLDQTYFRDNPENRVHYEDCYQRLRKAYTRLGIPLPIQLKVPPTSDLVKAKALLQEGKYDEARRILSAMIDERIYKELGANDAMIILAGHADSIKHSRHVLSVEDWQDVYRSLYILVKGYSDKENYNPEYERDLYAARKQIQKLNGTIPNL